MYGLVCLVGCPGIVGSHGFVGSVPQPPYYLENPLQIVLIQLNFIIFFSFQFFASWWTHID